MSVFYPDKGLSQYHRPDNVYRGFIKLVATLSSPSLVLHLAYKTEHMYQPVALFIGLRYMRGRSMDRFGRFVSWLSATGITLGVLALIIVLSVMNGFEHELKNSTLDLMPQAVLSTEQGHLDPHAIPAATLNLKGVTRVTSLSTGEVVLQSSRGVAAGIMLGIKPDEPDPLSPSLAGVKQSVLQAGSYKVILGKGLAASLGVTTGQQVRLIVPSASQFTPVGRVPVQRLFTVAGIYDANSEVGSYQILVNQQDASRLLRYPPGHITGWRLWLDDPLAVSKVSQQSLPTGLTWQDWRERKGDLFQAVKMEKNMMGLLISLIIAVAAFNIITSLGLLIMEKQGEVAILQTLGLTRRQIMLVFMIQGASAGMVGAILGAIAGVLITSQLTLLVPLIGLMSEGVTLPVAISWWQVTTITFSAIAVALLATFYPSWRAAAVQPAEALRYE